MNSGVLLASLSRHDKQNWSIYKTFLWLVDGAGGWETNLEASCSSLLESEEPGFYSLSMLPSSMMLGKFLYLFDSISSAFKWLAHLL